MEPYTVHGLAKIEGKYLLPRPQLPSAYFSILLRLGQVVMN